MPKKRPKRQWHHRFLKLSIKMKTVFGAHVKITLSNILPHLHGAHRASLCCGAEVIHPHQRTDETTCEKCGRLVEVHAVLNSDGEQIWPVPAWFVMNEAETPLPPSEDPEAFPEPFHVHLPIHLKRHRFPIEDKLR